jgi:hypothetical protein
MPFSASAASSTEATTDSGEHILGHRVLSKREIHLINRIKNYERAFLQLCTEFRTLLNEQALNAEGLEAKRLAEGEGTRWLGIGKTHIEQGAMALTRAIAQDDKG